MSEIKEKIKKNGKTGLKKISELSGPVTGWAQFHPYFKLKVVFIDASSKSIKSHVHLSTLSQAERECEVKSVLVGNSGPDLLTFLSLRISPFRIITYNSNAERMPTLEDNDSAITCIQVLQSFLRFLIFISPVIFYVSVISLKNFFIPVMNFLSCCHTKAEPEYDEAIEGNNSRSSGYYR